MHPAFQSTLVERYAAAKAQYPQESRRKRFLRVLYDSWPSLTDTPTAPNFHTDDQDPLDDFLEDGELGLIIRTDFSNDQAWAAFVDKIKEAQKELLGDINAPTEGEPTPAEPQDDPEESSSAEETDDIVKILDPTTDLDRAQLANISNINALRLFNDVDIRRTPPIPEGGSKVKSEHPLVDFRGWQEVYTGKTLWIYDGQSNTDECVRAVSQAGDVYGTATGDSWRARAPHVPELVFSIAVQGLKINFGGLDRWDFQERQRNLSDALDIE